MTDNSANKRPGLNLALCVPLMALLVATEGMAETAKTKQSSAPAAQPPAEEVAPMDKPLIELDGKVITSREYVSFLQGNPTILSRAGSSEEGKAEAFREIVRTYLLNKAMYSEGLLDKGEEDPPKKKVAEAYEKLAEKHFPIPARPDDKAGYAYYLAHQDEFGIPELVRLNEIYFKVPENAGQVVLAAAKERAEKAMKRLEVGEKFADVAAELTDNVLGKVTRGDVGFQPRDDKPWLKEALGDLKIGGRTGIVQTPTGFLILEITDIRPALISPYANVRDKVIKTMRDEEQKKMRDAYVNGLAKEAKIDVVEPEVKKLFPAGMFP